MMDAKELLLTRRSTRGFTAQPVDEAVLDRVLELASYAPTGKNLQCPQIVAVRDADTAGKVRALNAKTMGKEDMDPYYGAPVIAIVFAPKSVVTYMSDGASVLTYLTLAAHAEGLSSVWVFREKEMFELPEGKALMAEWGIPDDFEGIGAVAIGHAAGAAPAAPPRREGYIMKI